MLNRDCSIKCELNIFTFIEKLWKIMIVNSILISAITLSGKTTVSVYAGETDISAESEEDQQIPHSEALTD